MGRAAEARAATDAASLPVWLQLVEAVALLKILFSIGSLTFSAGAVPPLRLGIWAAHVAAFGSAGLLLRIVGRSDRRAVLLGVFFLVLGTVWADPLLQAWMMDGSALEPLLRALRHVQIVAFAPFLFWLFIREFPRRQRFEQGSRLVQLGIASALVLGVALLVANLGFLGLLSDREPEGVFRYLDRGQLGTLFWPLIFGATFPALVYAAWQARSAEPDERRRVRFLLAALIAGLMPEMVMTLLASVWPAMAAFALGEGRLIVGAIVYPPMLSIPFTTAYAVLVHQALDVRLIIRKALQYALARYSIAVVAAVPFMVLLVVIYLRREQSIVQLLSGTTGLVLVAATAAGIALLYLRPHLVNALDRRFFREQYDARRILGALVERTRAVRTPEELARVLAREIDRALHVQRVETLLLDPASGDLVASRGALPPLSPASRLVRWLEMANEPLEVEWPRPAEWLKTLPEPEQHWLGDGEVRLLVPVTAAEGSLIGVITLGEKRSELPFSAEDRLLLETLAGSVALAVEHRLLTVVSTTAGGAPAVQAVQAAIPTRECPRCGTVLGPEVSWCEGCAEATRTAAVPLLLAGKFRPIERIGSGGMGVVYRALDTTLGREVAIKTLPEMSANEARWLRQEARAMAAVSHPNLALIFGAESWFGVPMLIVEYLPGGTLDHRLAREGLPLEEAIETASGVAAALARLHESGILHRDIKPSNIGFSAEGTPKLLDFGLARVLEFAQQADPRAAPLQPGEPGGSWPSLRSAAGVSAAGGLVGTLPYLSPEAVNGEPPDAGFDLWALCMVLYEMIAGRHPLQEGTPHLLMLRIAEADIPDIREHTPDVPAPVAEFLRDALAARRGRRPASARELGRRLRELRQGVLVSVR